MPSNREATAASLAGHGTEAPRRSKSRRRAPEPVQRTNLKKILRLHRKEKTWQSGDFREFFRRIKSGRAISDVERDKDMPSHTAFHAYLKLPSLSRGVPSDTPIYRTHRVLLPFVHNLAVNPSQLISGPVSDRYY